MSSSSLQQKKNLRASIRSGPPRLAGGCGVCARQGPRRTWPPGRELSSARRRAWPTDAHCSLEFAGSTGPPPAPPTAPPFQLRSISEKAAPSTARWQNTHVDSPSVSQECKGEVQKTSGRLTTAQGGATRSPSLQSAPPRNGPGGVSGRPAMRRLGRLRPLGRDERRASRAVALAERRAGEVPCRRLGGEAQRRRRMGGLGRKHVRNQAASTRNAAESFWRTVGFSPCSAARR